jgi:RNA polymerase sigma factor (sigma-70 family)
MPEEASFNDLLARIRAGDDDAARRIFKEYAQRLIGLARVRLDTAVRRKLDAEDVIQSVFKSFFVRVGRGEFDLENWDSLWSLLVTITLRKCNHKVRDLCRQRQDIRREVAPKAGADDSAATWQAMAQGPTPSEAAMLAETVENILASLKDRERRILELYLQGHDIADIQTTVKRSEYTVRDVLKRVRKTLQRHRDEPQD